MKRVVVVVNKWCECEPVLGTLLNSNASPANFPWPMPAPVSPTPRPRQPPPVALPRAVFRLNSTSVELWCISDLDALELVWNATNSTVKFTFGLQYYGTSLGYMVLMVNETFDSFVSSAKPYFYWEFLLDGEPQNHGIDSTKLSSGQTVTFSFTQYVAAQHAGTSLEAKHKFQISQAAS